MLMAVPPSVDRSGHVRFASDEGLAISEGNPGFLEEAQTGLEPEATYAHMDLNHAALGSAPPGHISEGYAAESGFQEGGYAQPPPIMETLIDTMDNEAEHYLMEGDAQTYHHASDVGSWMRRQEYESDFHDDYGNNLGSSSNPRHGPDQDNFSFESDVTHELSSPSRGGMGRSLLVGSVETVVDRDAGLVDASPVGWGGPGGQHGGFNPQFAGYSGMQQL